MPEPEPVARIIAHRGSSGRAPENTLTALRLALDEDHADGLELDLQRSAEGEVMVLHDETIDRTTDGTGRCSDYSLEQLREFDAGARFLDTAGHAVWAGQGVVIPTLREVLEEFPGAWMSLDLKQGDPVTERSTIALLREYERRDSVVVSAESPAAAKRIARAAPEFRCFLDRSAVREFYLRHRFHFWTGYRPRARSLQIPDRYGRHDLSTPHFVEDAHRHGLQVIYWTINSPARAQELLDRGADGIITDWPHRMATLRGAD